MIRYDRISSDDQIRPEDQMIPSDDQIRFDQILRLDNGIEPNDQIGSDYIWMMVMPSIVQQMFLVSKSYAFDNNLFGK